MEFTGNVVNQAKADPDKDKDKELNKWEPLELLMLQ